MTSDHSAEAIAAYPTNNVWSNMAAAWTRRVAFDAGRASRQSEVDALQARIDRALAIVRETADTPDGYDHEMYAALTGGNADE